MNRDLRASLAKRAAWASVILWIPTLTGFLGGAWWVLDLSSHFRVQWAVLSLLCLAASLLRPSRASWLAVVPCAVNLACIGPLFFAPARATTDGPTVVSFNVHTSNERKEEVVSFLAKSGADVILLYEVDTAWLDALNDLAEYRSIAAIPSSDNFGIAALARVPVTSHRVLDLSPYGVPTIELTIPWRGREMVLLGTHTLPPMSADYAAARDAQLANIGVWSASEQRPHAVLGDLNTTPWSAHFRALLQEGGLTSLGSATPTWPYSAAMGWMFRIPIDHVLVSGLTGEARACESYGSDHRAVTARLGFGD